MELEKIDVYIGFYQAVNKLTDTSWNIFFISSIIFRYKNIFSACDGKIYHSFK